MFYNYDAGFWFNGMMQVRCGTKIKCRVLLERVYVRVIERAQPREGKKKWVMLLVYFAVEALGKYS